MAKEDLDKQLENGISLLVKTRQKLDEKKDFISSKDFLKDLFEVRKMMLLIVNMYKKETALSYDKFIDSSELLREINTSICQITGHAYSNWSECSNVRGPRVIIERKCAVCGKVERIYAPPGQALTAKEEGKPLAKRMNYS